MSGQIMAATAARQNHSSALETSATPPLTADDILLLARNPSATLPSSFSSSSLLPLLQSPSPALLSSLVSLLSRSPPSPSLLSLLLISFLRLFFSRRLPRDPNSSRIFQLFFPLLPHLDQSHLPSLLDLLSSHFPDIADADDAQALDLLPHFFDLASADDNLINTFLDKLLSLEWSKALLVKMCSLIHECLPMSRVRVSEFLQKIFAGMRSVDIQDIPSLAFQLLLLASKGISSISRKQLIGNLLRFFGEPMKGSASVVQQVEGTVLMHVNFAVKQYPSLGSVIISVVRSDLGTFNHFSAAILLSVARIRRFNESSIGALKSVVVGSHQDCKFARNCKWLPNITKEELLQTVKHIDMAIVRTINVSSCGREHVVPSILQFGFFLLESMDRKTFDASGSSNGLMGCEELGIQILKTVFELHEMARNQVLEQCKFQILSLKHQQSTPVIKLLGHLAQNYPYQMLEYVARLKELLDYFTFMHDKTAVYLIRAILPLIKFSKDLRDYIILVVRKAMFRREDDVRTAAASTIIDIIIEENRSKKNGLNSFQESSSQASSSQQAGLFCRMEGGLFQELNGLLRRCLTQQVTVKEIVYKGLTKLVMLDPTISGDVFDFLWPHFLKFYSQNAEYPLRIDSCFAMENGKISQFEPLDHLLSSVSLLFLLQHGRSDHQSEYSLPCFGFSLSQDNEAGRVSSGELFLNALSNIRKSLSKWIFEGVFKQSEGTSSHSFKEERVGIYGCLLLGILEVFINIAATELEKAAHEDKVVLEKEIMWLVDSYDYVEKESGLNKQGSGIRKESSNSIVQHKADRESKESPRTSQLKIFPFKGSLLTTSTIHKILILAANSYNNSSFISQTTLNHTQSSSCRTSVPCLKLVSFALRVCFHHLKFIISIGGISSNDPYKAIIYGNLKQLALPIMQLVWFLKSRGKTESATKKKDAKEKKSSENKRDDLHLALLSLNELFRMSSSKAYLAELIEELDTLETPEFDPGNTFEAPDGRMGKQPMMVDDPFDRRFHAFLDKRVKPLYTGLIALSLFQEAVVVSELFLIIWRSIPFEQRKVHGMWMMNACKNRKILNPKHAQNLVALALHIMPCTNDLIAAQDIASELLQVMGSEEKDPVEISKTYLFVNNSTKLAVTAALFQLIESCLADLDWSVSKLKAVFLFKHDFVHSTRDNQFSERLPGVILETAVHFRSEALVYVLSFFADMNLKDSQAEQFLKLTAMFYKLLARMTKLQIAPKGCKQLLPEHKFQKLAEVACRKLTTKLYDFVALVQRNQQENVCSRGIINKIKRENRCIPDLIFQIEDYERYLIQLSKLTKVNFLRNAKRSTIRDFKILEMKKAPAQEEETEHEPAPISSDSSESESGNESEEHDIDNASEKVASPVYLGEDGAAEDSESDKDALVLIKNKRAKMSKVVHDSEDEV